MKDYYKIMGVSPSASQDKIRRAYRILARRYHPDVNPGQESSDKFKAIAEAYQVLKNAERRKAYNQDYAAYQKQRVGVRIRGYQTDGEQQRQQQHRRPERTEDYYTRQKRDYDALKSWQHRQPKPSSGEPKQTDVLKYLSNYVDKGRKLMRSIFGPKPHQDKEPQQEAHASLSVIEVTVSLKEAVYGGTKSVTFEEGAAKKTVKVKIPVGVRNGSVVRLRSRGRAAEEVLCIIRVERHPQLHLEPEGLMVDVPVSVHEAIAGALVTVPTLKGPETVKISPCTQSGSIIRLKGKGALQAEGPGDLLVRVMVHVPESDLAVGIKEKSAQLDQYYETPVRQRLPDNLREMLDKKP